MLANIDVDCDDEEHRANKSCDRLLSSEAALQILGGVLYDQGWTR